MLYVLLYIFSDILLYILLHIMSNVWLYILLHILSNPLLYLLLYTFNGPCYIYYCIYWVIPYYVYYCIHLVIPFYIYYSWIKNTSSPEPKPLVQEYRAGLVLEFIRSGSKTEFSEFRIYYQNGVISGFDSEYSSGSYKIRIYI